MVMHVASMPSRFTNVEIKLMFDERDCVNK